MRLSAVATAGARRALAASVEVSMLVVEEHALVRAALRTLLDATDGLRVVAEARDWAPALDKVRTHRPDVVLLSERIWNRAGGAAMAALRRAAPETCVLLLVDDDTAGRARAASGANGHLAADAGLPELCDAVEAVLGGQCPSCAFKPHCPVPRIAVALSRREEQVAIRVADGLTSKQIAAELGVGLRTVHTYRESLAQKLGASSAAVVTRFVLESGLTEPV